MAVLVLLIRPIFDEFTTDRTRVLRYLRASVDSLLNSCVDVFLRRGVIGDRLLYCGFAWEEERGRQSRLFCW